MMEGWGEFAASDDPDDKSYFNNNVDRLKDQFLAALQTVAAGYEKRIVELEEKVWGQENAYKMAMDEKCSGDQVHCSCVPILRVKIAELERALGYIKKTSLFWKDGRKHSSNPGALKIAMNCIFRVAAEAVKEAGLEDELGDDSPTTRHDRFEGADDADKD